MTTPSDQYHEICLGRGPLVVVLGDPNEQWTGSVLDVLKKNGVESTVFVWRDIVDVRLQLDLLRYPVTQVWFDGELKKELIGFDSEKLRDLLDLYFTL